MTHGFHRLIECKRHGYHATETCPLCETDPAPPAEDPKPAPKARWHDGKERELHDQFERWLRFHEIEFIHSRMDKPSTIEKGWPDFSCFRHHNGHDLACFVEFKTRQGRLRLDQEEVIARMARRGIDVLVTGDFTEACDFVRARLALKAGNAKDQAPAESGLPASACSTLVEVKRIPSNETTGRNLPLSGCWPGAFNTMNGHMTEYKNESGVIVGAIVETEDGKSFSYGETPQKPPAAEAHETPSEVSPRNNCPEV